MFPTAQLYELPNNLTIRQLLILHTTLTQHKHTESERAKRQSLYSLILQNCLYTQICAVSRSFLYNRLTRIILNLCKLTKLDCIRSICNYLKTLSFEDTEPFLSISSSNLISTQIHPAHVST